MSQTHHTVDPKFTYFDKRARKDVVLYVGLLDAAHRAGFYDLSTDILQFPDERNGHTCIVQATVRFWSDDRDHGARFQAIGDANPQNVGAAIAPHFIRMAETRAKARALRDALNIGMVTAEELGGADQPPEDDDGHARNAAPAFATPRAAPLPAGAPAYDEHLTWTDLWSWARPRGFRSKAEVATALGRPDSVVNDWTPAEIRTALEVHIARRGQELGLAGGAQIAG